LPASRPEAAAVAVLVLLAGCAPQIYEPVLPARVDYACGGGKTLSVERGDGRYAVVQLDGRPVTLRRADSAAQEKYSEGGLALYLDGERAMLEQEGRVLLGPCNTPTALPMAPRVR
jgi:membrane-bound inhibitor of C-type lysozyme